MVERLKIAVEKARALREQAVLPEKAPLEGLTVTEPAAPPAEAPVQNVLDQNNDADWAAAWNALGSLDLDTRHLERNRVVAYGKDNPGHAGFDVLRTRMLAALARNGWTRVGITSPSKGCGKTFVATNLAFSMARQPNCRTILMDMDMRQPSIGKVLGAGHQDSLRWFLTGEIPAAKYLRRVGSNLAVGTNSGRMRDSAEVIQTPSTAHALNTMHKHLDPTVVIYDLPPMLACDDVTAFLPQLDCVLLIIGGGTSKPSDVTECETLLKDQCPLLGVLVNKAEGVAAESYLYY